MNIKNDIVSFAVLLTLLFTAGCGTANQYTISTTTSSTTTQTTASQTTTTTSSYVLNQVEQYAKDSGLSNNVISLLQPLGVDGMDENEKAFIDYLSQLSKAGVVSDEVLQLAPAGYEKQEIDSLQVEVINDATKVGISSDESKALAYLSTFPGSIQRMYIESEIDSTTIKYLLLNSSLNDQNFAKNNVTNRLCVSLTDPEMKYLNNPSQANLESLLASYETDLKKDPDIGQTLLNQMQQLPEYKKDPTTVEVMEDITNLIDTATNPEVNEAFGLMINGGIPSQSDVNFTVPTYNTELDILFSLAEQNEFNKNDTTALAIAAVNGIWIARGDSDVKQAVFKDTNDLLNFFRQTNEIQKARGFPQLEDYPLEAKVCLAWTGNQSPVFSQDHALFLFSSSKLDLYSYNWNNVSVDTLRQMRKYMDSRWVKDVGSTVNNIGYKYIYSHPEDKGKVIVDGKEVNSWFLGNVDFLFEYFLKNGVGIGVCTDEEAITNAFCKSCGIATNAIQMIKTGASHTSISYYEPTAKKWKIQDSQIQNFYSVDPQLNRYLYVFKPPSTQNGYTGDSSIVRDYLAKGWVYIDNGAFVRITDNISDEEMKNFLSAGIDTQQMKTWILPE